MQIKLGQIYKVKPEFRKMCSNFNSKSDSVYVRYNGIKMEILNENKKIILVDYESSRCFKPEHLEPIEKTLYNLEINDFIKNNVGNKRKVLGLIESDPENPIYVLSEFVYFENSNSTYSAKELEVLSYQIVQPKPIEEVKEMTVEEVSKLVGKKVKIVE